jgi:anion-transporting  ArsA/GET3 family ATPase
MSASLASLLREKHILVTCGAGGVGKTTTAAAISVAAAKAGRRVLCLTIDPAKRLAESLGLKEMRHEAMVVDPSRFAERGIPITGSLTAMMLDTKRTFDELVEKYSSSPEKAQALLNNKLYRYMSTSLAGTQEYMAMEKLVAVKNDPAYDLIVLDTPPTANALDFLDAPERMVGALDSPAMKWLAEAFGSSGRFSMNILAKGAATVLKGIGKITGGGFLEDMSQFVAQLQDLFGGFRERAVRVQNELRSPGVAFLLVTSPSPASIEEALFFSEKLREHRMPRGAFIVNRFRAASAQLPTEADAHAAANALREKRLPLDGAPETRLLQAFAESAKLAEADARSVARLAAEGVGTIVRVPEFATDVHDLVLLDALAQWLEVGGV